MCEKFLALLFRLYPPAFRERYLAEALLLCRDRRHYETGIYRSVRLACDLLVDYFAGLPRAWQTSCTVVTARSQVSDAQLVPSFRLLNVEPLRPASILLGGMLSLTAIGVFALILRATPLHPIEGRALSPIDSVLQRLNQPALPPTQNVDLKKVAGEVPVSARAPHPVQPERTNLTGAKPRSAPSRNLPPHVEAPNRLVASPLPNDGLAGTTFAGKFSVNTATRGLAAFGPAVSAAPGRENAFASQGEAHPQDATQAMIQAISAHQIVMFGETHGNKQEYEWLCRLAKTPRFAERVDDIVVEFGNSLYQKTVDRYIAGENVPLAQVQKAWRNVIGAVGPVSPVYAEFYRAVRESNLERRSGHQIRLLLGDPYGDWDKINNAEDLGPYLGHRDEWYAEVVKEEVLAHHHRALLIMGAGHFVRRNGPGLVEQAIRAAGVQPYVVAFGTNAVGRYDDLDHRFDAWTLPAIVALSGTWVGELPANPVLTGGNVAPDSQRMEDVADAMFYIGSRDNLTQVFVSRSELVDTSYGNEIERRLQIQTGHSVEFTEASEGPQYLRPLQQTVSNGIRRLPPNPPKSINDPLPPRPLSQ